MIQATPTILIISCNTAACHGTRGGTIVNTHPCARKGRKAITVCLHHLPHQDLTVTGELLLIPSRLGQGILYRKAWSDRHQPAGGAYYGTFALPGGCPSSSSGCVRVESYKCIGGDDNRMMTRPAQRWGGRGVHGRFFFAFRRVAP